MGRWFKVALGVVVSAACLWLAFRKVSLGEVWATASTMHGQFIALCSLFGISALWMRSVRWRILLQASEPVRLGTAFAVNASGQMGNMILPARLGDIFRATSMARAGLSNGFCLATVFAERVLDAGFLVLISALALTTFSRLPAWLNRSSWILAVAALAGLAITLFLPKFEVNVQRAIVRLAPQRLHAKLNHVAREFLLGLRSFHHPQRAAGFLGCTILIWILDGCGVAFLARGLGIFLSPTETALFLTSIALASVIPAAPGNLGVQQFVAMNVLAPFGVPQAQALSLALIMQMLNTVTLGVIGAGGLWFLSFQQRPQGRKLASLGTPVPVADLRHGDVA